MKTCHEHVTTYESYESEFSRIFRPFIEQVLHISCLLFCFRRLLKNRENLEFVNSELVAGSGEQDIERGILPKTLIVDYFFLIKKQ